MKRKTNGARGTHSLETAEERTLARHRKNPRGSLTLWRQQRKGLVTTRKETDQVRGTHILETAEGGTFQDTERN
jgi:hypothetical protein